LLVVVSVEGSAAIQFSHFAVKEFLTSIRLAESSNVISRRYHISMTAAHTLVARACLGILLHLSWTRYVIKDNLKKIPLAEYAAKHWVDHARFENVSQHAEDGMKHLFDPSKPHLAVGVWIHHPTSRRTVQPERPLLCPGDPLHYVAVWGLHVIVEYLVTGRPFLGLRRQGDSVASGVSKGIRGSRPHTSRARRGFDDTEQVWLDTITRGITGGSRSRSHQARRKCSSPERFRVTQLHMVSRRGHVEVPRSTSPM
jgi:hypothetical protein